MISVRIQYTVHLEGLSHTTDIQEWRPFQVANTNQATLIAAVKGVYPTAFVNNINILQYILDSPPPASMGGS